MATAVPILRRVLGVAIGSLVGGALAIAVLALTADVDRPQFLLTLVVAAMAFCSLAAISLSTGGRRTSGRRTPPAGQPEYPSAPRPTYAPPPPPPPAATVPPQAAAARPAWYEEVAQRGGRNSPKQPAAQPSSQAEAAVYPPLPPARILPVAGQGAADGSAQIVQCPRCGGFPVDARTDNAAFTFSCHRCGHRWAWAAGHPWPTVLIRPRLWAPPPMPTT